MTPEDIKAGQTAVSLITLYRDWVMDRGQEPTLEEFMLVLQPSANPQEALQQLMGINSALVAMVIALLEHSGESDELLRKLASNYTEGLDE